MDSTYTPENTLGPFLCKPTEKSMGFWMAFKNHPNIETIEIDILNDGISVNTFKLAQESNVFNSWIGSTTLPLTPNTQYTYSVKIDGINYEPSWVEDFKFKTLSDDPNAEVTLISMSCHGVEAWNKKHNAKDAFAMWEKIYLEIENGKVQLAVLGGDQVYMDDTFEDRMKVYSKLPVTERIKMIRKVYFMYWGDEKYQRVFARVAAVLMWDDHDLNDGFGSRLDSFKGDELNDNWTLFKKDLTTAFWAFQACRNPNDAQFNLENIKTISPTIDESYTPLSNYTFKFETAQFSFIGLDLRSERNVRKEQLISDTSREKIHSLIKDSEDKPLLILSPVTFTRISGSIEEILGQFANLMWQYTHLIGYGKSKWKSIYWLFAFVFPTFILATSPNSTIISGIALSIYATLFIFPVLPYFKKNKAIQGLIHSIFIGIVLLIFAAGAQGILKFISPSHSFLEELESFKENFQLNWIKYLIFALCTTFGFLALHSHSNKKTNTLKFISYALLSISFICFLKFDIYQAPSAWDYLPKAILLCTLFISIVATILETIGAIDEVAGLDDDIKDAWSSEVNAKEIGSFFNKIKPLKNNIYFLCGDIHTGGISQIRIGEKLIPQITTSPISYVPMGAIVEKFTSGNKRMNLPAKNPVACGENYFYISERNFSVITIHTDKTVTTKFVFENRDSSVSVKLGDTIA